MALLKDLTVFGATNLISDTFANHIYGNGYHHNTRDNNDSVLLAGGSYKGWSESVVNSSLVARNSSGNIYVNDVNTTADDMASTDFTKVYVSDSNFIKYVTKDKFAEAIRGNDTLTFTKTLKVTEVWMDTGIRTGDANTTDTINKGNGTYAVQISHGTLPPNAVGTTAAGADSWPAIYSGIMSIYTGETNGTLTDEVILHRSGHAGGKRLYLRIVQLTNNPKRCKIEIAASANFKSNAQLTFKFRKII